MQAQNGDAFGDEDDEEEQPPTEYDDDGILTTSLHSFADLRIIKDMASSVHGTGTFALFHVCAGPMECVVCGAKMS